MPRRLRHTRAGTIFHVINRSVGRHTIFHKPEDYGAFERVLAEAHARIPLCILAYTLMPNHWHFKLEALRQSVDRGAPFGDDDWQKRVVADLGLEATLRPRGRPSKTAQQDRRKYMIPDPFSSPNG